MKYKTLGLIIAIITVIFISACKTGFPLPPDTVRINQCVQDSDCVRQKSCCECGLGTYVNVAYQRNVTCDPAQLCNCAIMDSIGKCINDTCVAVDVNAPPQ